MAQFDIQTLDAIEPLRFHCAKCLALFWEPTRSLSLDVWEEATTRIQVQHICPECQRGDIHHTHPLCPICGVRYVPAAQQPKSHLEHFLLSRHPSPWPLPPINTAFKVRFLAHCHRLGALAADSHRGVLSPGAALLQAIAVAQAFVHCVSFGLLTHQIMDKLFNAALQIPVRGVIATSDSEVQKHLEEAEHAHPHLNLKPQRSPFYPGDVQYQQLFIIDGLIAFRGSANDVLMDISDALPRKAALEVITESDAVLALHNRYFSPAWIQQSQEHQVIVME